MEPNDNLDRLLDEALSDYGKTQPRAGLESRIVANLQAERVRRVHRCWWAVAVPVTALLIVCAWLGLRPKGWENGPEPQAVRSAAANPLPPPASNVKSQDVSIASRAPAHRTLARKGRGEGNRSAAVLRQSGPLLSTRPLSEEEKLLAAYVSMTPARELVSPARTAKNLNDLEIGTLHVGKLETPSLSSTEAPTDATN